MTLRAKLEVTGAELEAQFVPKKFAFPFFQSQENNLICFLKIKNTCQTSSIKQIPPNPGEVAKFREIAKFGNKAKGPEMVLLLHRSCQIMFKKF